MTIVGGKATIQQYTEQMAGEDRSNECVKVYSLDMLVQVKNSQAPLKIGFAQLYWVIHSETAWG